MGNAIKINKKDTDKEILNLTILFEVLPEYIKSNGFNLLPINYNHLFQLKNLPSIINTLFDRLIIAEAIADKMIIIFKDRHFEYYTADLIW